MRRHSGLAYRRTVQCGGIRLRMVEYTPGYLADHWCTKGHVLLCLEGELHTELRAGRAFVLTPGMSYQVADDTEPHRSWTRVEPRCSSWTERVYRSDHTHLVTSCGLRRG
jgi:hypothetical protein